MQPRVFAMNAIAQGANGWSVSAEISAEPMMDVPWAFTIQANSGGRHETAEEARQTAIAALRHLLGELEKSLPTS